MPNVDRIPSGKKEEQGLELLGLDIFPWGWDLPREGVRVEKFGISVETQAPPPTILSGYPASAGQV